MEFSKFSRTAKTVGLFLTASFMIGCTEMPQEGNYLVRKGFFGNKYEPEINKGRAWYLIDTIQEVYGKEILYTLENQTPKDKNGVLIQDLDLTIAVKVNPKHSKGENIVKFIVERSAFVKDREKDAFVIGESYIKKDGASVLSKYFATIDSEALLNDKTTFESEFSKILQKELDSLYGEDMFYIEDVKVASFKAGQATEEKIQSINAIKAEEIKNAELLKAANSKKQVMLTNAQMLKDVSKETGLSVDQILESELINTLNSGSTSVKPVADVTQVVKNKLKP